MGKLGFDIVVSKLPENDLKFCQLAIKNYNELKQVIWKGSQYRLANPSEGSVASMLYVSEDQSAAVSFNYLVNSRYDEGSKLPIRMQGLNSDKKYRLTEINLYPGTTSSIDSAATYSGDFLMKVGFNPNVKSDRSSVVIKIEELK